MPSNIIAIVGMPGAGKSTLARAIAEMFDLQLVVTGDLARELAKTDPEVAQAMLDGRMAPKEKMNEAMRKVVAEAIILGKTIVLEGYPRYAEQMDDLQFIGGDSVRYVVVGCNDGVARQRMLERRRDDDKPDIIDRRLMLYWDETYPILSRIVKPIFLSIGTKLDVQNAAITALINEGALQWKRPEPQSSN